MTSEINTDIVTCGMSPGGKRGSNEIGSCLLKFIKTMKEKGCREFCIRYGNMLPLL